MPEDAVPPDLRPLREPELRLVAALRDGRALDLTDGHLPDPKDPTVKIRAQVLRWLIAQRGSADAVPVSGLQLTGAHVEGDLDLAGFRVTFPLSLQRCALRRIVLTDANLATLHLGGSHCAALDADRLRVESSLLLANGFMASELVFLRNAMIGGDLYCAGGTFTQGNDSAWAFLFDGARVSGRMFMRGASVKGPFQGASARIEGGFVCIDARFSNPAHGAVRLARVRVGGRVTFKRARVEGRLNLSRGQIGGDLDLSELDCSKAPSDGSINLDGVSVSGALTAGGLTTTGRVRFRGGSVAGEVEWEGACLKANGAGERALMMAGTKIGGRLVLRAMNASGGVNLTGTSIALDVTADTETRIDGGSNAALALNRARVGGNVELPCALAGRPSLNVASTRIAGDLELRQAVLETDEFAPAGFEAPVSARGEGLLVEGSVLATGVQASADVRLPRAQIAGDLDFSGAQFTRGQVVIGASRVGGRLLFEDSSFTATGKDVLSMVSATVAGRFGWTPNRMPKKAGMDLRYSSVGYLDDGVASWPYDMRLRMAGFSYQDTEDSMCLDQRLRWIQIATSERYTPQPYEQLITVLRRTGKEADARTAARQKQKDARPSLGPLARTSNVLLGVTLGYGYQVWRALAAALALLVIGTVVFAAAHSSNDFHAVKKDAPAPGFNAFSYSLDTLLPVVNLHQEDYRLPEGAASVYLGVQIVAGWVLTTLLAFGLTGLARRD